MRASIFLVALICAGYGAAEYLVLDSPLDHHDQQSMLKTLRAINSKCKSISRIYTLNETSVEGRELAVIEFAAQPGDHIAGIPEFKWVGNMHGNEVVGRELVIQLADWLCEKYKSGDEGVRALITHTRLHLMPTMNPDGWQIATDDILEHGKNGYTTGRQNANKVDLNRNFPDVDKIIYDEDTIKNNHIWNMNMLKQKQSPKIQPETLAVIEWIMWTPFVLSANLHGGDLVANYPYDRSPPGSNPANVYSGSPDDETFRYLAESYAAAHTIMAKEHPACDKIGGDDFYKQGGITNGAAWYSLKGGMQDFNYLATNCFELTLELGCTKYPPKSELQSFWEQNLPAMYSYMWQTHIGVKGFVVNEETDRGISNALIEVHNMSAKGAPLINHDVTSAFSGDYYRLLPPGTYAILASAKRHTSQLKCVVVEDKWCEDPFKCAHHTPAQRLDFELLAGSSDDMDVDPSCDKYTDGNEGLMGGQEDQEESYMDRLAQYGKPKRFI